MDLAIIYNGTELTLDLTTLDVDLAANDGLHSAVLVSLFTDRRAANDDLLPSSALDRRGWWADA
ncbi:phage GP46 family protein [Candidatus Vondammii sp. HM_W22]|uniref:phage GP46 family protein n=1 Tax=Candidatus Vondammii sp. HM_W22 TaxID=2687299 RepID=UPI001F14030D|nr:phage GP46 family protein [Candidatus Vondammii sp. HM_W22]